ncbi:hypothetical protein [Hydrogenophaga sp.]|uniref:hypothetical protein n=1 Tax=Hydrogenophaga sp. TaxID=1904254 RepID=UPI00271E7DAC|nr:hypothetical protein [Hydrogenophaga sp.]MDO9434471.1 hypothetical protein [Hydrogenophaga sp.]
MRGTDSSSNSSSASNPTWRDPYNAARSPTSGPSAKTLAAWTLLMDEVQLDDATTARAFLKNLARGHADNAGTARAVFNDLIAHEAYGLFAQVFAATNTLLKAQAKADGRAFTSTLVLKLPHGWKPTAPALMHETFAAAGVQRVEVLRPDPAQASDAPDDPTDLAIPEAAGDVVATLLRAGASELSVSGVLAHPAGVRDAMRASNTLTSLELGEARLHRLTALEKACYETLLIGWKSDRLKHLTLRQADIFSPLQPDAKAELPSWPALASLNLGGINVSSIPRVRWLLSVATQSQGLKAVSLSFIETGTHPYIESTLTRLKYHRSLTHVSLQGAAISPNSPACLRVLDLAIELAHSCRSLTHFAWDSGNRHVSGAAQAMARNFNFLDIRDWLQRPSAAVEAALGDPNFKLEWLSLTGMYFSSGGLASFFRGIAVNKTLRGFDFSRSSVCARATTILTTSLKTNHTLAAPVFPKNPADFFMVMNLPAEAIRALCQGPNRSDRVDATGHRRIRDDVQLARVEANAYRGPEHLEPLDADLKEHLDTLQERLHERQLAFMPNAVPELALDLAQLMASAVIADDADRVRKLRSKGAIDYGGRARKMAEKKSSETLAAMAKQRGVQ